MEHDQTLPRNKVGILRIIFQWWRMISHHGGLYVLELFVGWTQLSFSQDNISLRASSQGKRKCIILVNGAPRSGTTWTVSMVAAVPGYRKIGNFQHNLQGYETVNPGDVIHGHDHYTEPLKDALKLHRVGFILTMRDPRDQVVSRLFHIRRTPNHAWQTHLQNMSNDEG